MNNKAIFLLVVACAASLAVCGRRMGVAVAEAGNSQAHKPGSKPDEQPKQGGPKHGHDFSDPEAHAKRWNDPERDQWQHPEEIIAALALKPGATVADIGAGTGYMVAHLSKAVGKTGTVIPIDIEPAMVQYLTKRIRELGPAKVAPRKAAPDDPGFQSAGMDGVLTLDVWHHIDGPEAYARKVYEGLKRGGRFVVVDFEIDAEPGPPKAMRLKPEQIVKHLKAGGFRVEIAPESMPRHYMIVGYKD